MEGIEDEGKIITSVGHCQRAVILLDGVAAASALSGVPTAAQLTNAADQQMCACGFPDLSSVGTATAAMVPQDTIDATILQSPICGVCGAIPDCTCNTETNNILGPQVNLGCPLITTFAVPVDLNVPAVEADLRRRSTSHRRYASASRRST